MRLELEVGPVAHGGHMVARTAEGQVVFVRHALPGERVVASVTEAPTAGARFLRADAVEVLDPSPRRVPPPCPYAGPGRCGGCDFQHVSLPEQRRLKAAVVEEQLRRLAGIEREVVVEEVEPTLRWRSRMQYVDLGLGRRGLRKHRSHEVVEIDDCLIDANGPFETGLDGPPQGPGKRVPEEGRSPVSKGPSTLGPSRIAAPAPQGPDNVVETVTTSAGTRDFEVAAEGFWQPHVAAPRVLVEAVLSVLELGEGERALDLYAGVGLFTRYVAEAVGPNGSVVAVEGDRIASRHSRDNLADLPWVRSLTGPVDRVLRRGVGPVDVVVLDPPRAGAKKAVVRSIAELAPRAVCYVACDPAALARDLGYFAGHGYGLEALRAFDLFPMTQHVECVALLERGRRRAET